MNHTEINIKYGVNIDAWKWMSIVTAIPKEWRLKIKQDQWLQSKIRTAI